MTDAGKREFLLSLSEDHFIHKREIQIPIDSIATTK